MNEEEKKVIKMLDKFTTEHKFYNIKHSDNLEDNIEIVLKLIEKLQKENEELRKKLNEENKRCMMLAIEKQDYFEKYRYHLQQNESLTKEFSNVISVQKVKDKIEEINKKILNAPKYDEKISVYRYQKQILQKLIEESEKK